MEPHPCVFSPHSWASKSLSFQLFLIPIHAILGSPSNFRTVFYGLSRCRFRILDQYRHPEGEGRWHVRMGTFYSSMHTCYQVLSGVRSETDHGMMLWLWVVLVCQVLCSPARSENARATSAGGIQTSWVQWGTYYYFYIYLHHNNYPGGMVAVVVSHRLAKSRSHKWYTCSTPIPRHARQ